MDTHDGQETITLDPRQRIREENKCRTHVATAVPSRLVTSGADTDSVDDETDVNSADLQGFCAGVNWKRCQLELTIFPATSRVFLLKRSPQGWRMRQWICLLSREALVTIRAARDKMKGKSEGKGEPARLIFWKGPGESGENPAQPNICRTNWLRGKSKSTCHECGQRGHCGQMINHFQIARTVEPSWWLNGLDNLVSILSVQISASIQSCTNSVSNFRCSSVDEHIPVSPVVTDTVSANTLS